MSTKSLLPATCGPAIARALLAKWLLLSLPLLPPLAAAGACGAAEPPRVATFRCDVTPPKGQPLFYGDPVGTVAEPLLAKGIVIESAGRRHVLCAIDWCAVSNGTHLSLRRRLAEAVGARPDDVAVQTLHQHSAPLVDIDAQRILAEHGDATAHVDPEWLAATEARIAAAAEESLAGLRAFDRVGAGRARVDRVASNRRVRDAAGAVAGRTSLAPAPLRELPEGRIDPFLRTVTLAAGDEPLVRLHYYATHPQVNYGDGVATSDFVGLAREEMERREGVAQVYFTGCAGDVTVGKYNDGSDTSRRAFADRLLVGMAAAVAATAFEPVEAVEWRTHPFLPPRRRDGDFAAAACVGRMRDPQASPVDRLYRGAMRLASVRREGEPIVLSGLRLGSVHLLHLPGEPLVDFQLFAQRLLPDEFVAVTAYGDNATGYICTAEEFAAGGYEASVSICTPEVDGLLRKGIAALLQPADAVVEPLPRIPPREPAAALGSFSLAPGYRIEQAAAEPLVRSPVALDFDERGRCFVVEMIDYSEQEHERLGAIRLLSDADGDGRFDTGRVFAAGLSWPTGVLCADGGLFVCAAPDILHLRDDDGDGVADTSRVVFTGFGRGNVQGLLNSLRWGLDGRIHGATSSAGAPRVVRPDDPSFEPVDLDGRDFSFDPRRLDLRPEAGCLQHGMTFDDWGRKFVSGNSDPVEMVFYEDRYAARNPFHALPPSRGPIAVDGGAAEVFRTSPVEPWRVLRTRMRNADPSLGPVEAGGRPAGTFTGASGITAYRGDAFPAEMRECVVVGDVGGNLVHRERLTPAGPFLEARRVDRGSEFARSEDVWFRPAQFANGPDGTLYVIDMYREVIEHPKSLPPEIKQQFDLASGSDRGRIYRIVPDGFVPRPRDDLSSMSTGQLVALLAHRNGWHRDTASRLLCERQDAAAAEPLERLARESLLPEGRMHAMYVLAALAKLTVPAVLGGLADDHPRVREHAVRLAERFSGEAAVSAALCRLTGDPDARVRYQLAFSLGELPVGPDRTRALADLAVRDGAGVYPRAALGTSLATGAVDLLADLAARPGYADSPAGAALLEEVAAQVGRRLDPAEVAGLESAVAAAPPAGLSLWAGFWAGRLEAAEARRAAQPPSRAAAAARAIVLDRSRVVALDEAARIDERVSAVRRLAIGGFADSAAVFGALLRSRQPQALQRAAVEAMSRIGAPETGAWLLARWSQLGPGLRSAAAAAVFGRTEWVRAFFDAVEEGRVPLSDVDPAQVRLLAIRREPMIRAGYARLAERLQTSPRREVLAAYRPALGLPGDAARGAAHFARACAQCHRLASVGHEVGPSLAGFAQRGPEAILLHVLDPNREVNPLYLTYVAELVDGRVVTGMIADETTAGVTLRRAEAATDTIRRADIERLESTGQSLMPEGLEKQLDVQAVADLIAHLMAAAGGAPAPAVEPARPSAVVRPAAEVRLPSDVGEHAIDCNMPAHWSGDTLHVLTSGGGIPKPLPRRCAGPDLFRLADAGEVRIDNDADFHRDRWGRWFEATWQDGSGALYGWYHHEPGDCCPEPRRSFALTSPRIGAAVSRDDGRTWTDLGIVLAAPPGSDDCRTANLFFAGGHGDFTVVADASREHLYFLFSTYCGPAQEQGVAVARMCAADRDAPVGRVFKWRDGAWGEAGVGGRCTPVLPAAGSWHGTAPDAFWGPSVHWNTHLGQFVMLVNRTRSSNWAQEGAYVSFNPDIGDPRGWSRPTKIRDGGEYYVQVIGAARGETDKEAGRVARLFVHGRSHEEIVFLRPGEPAAAP